MRLLNSRPEGPTRGTGGLGGKGPLRGEKQRGWQPQAHRVCGLGGDFQELLLGSSLCLAGFLQVLLQLICLLGPARREGALSSTEDDRRRKETPLPP